VPSPNNQANLGEDNDAYIPNELARSPGDLQNFVKLGGFLAVMMMTETSIPLVLPDIVLNYFETG
jgi:hypothetical protein